MVNGPSTISNPIFWNKLGLGTDTPVNNTPLTISDNVPTSPIGLYTFTKVAPGDYILEITRSGFLTRFAKITVNSDGSLGHRELIAGAVAGGMDITDSDMSAVKSKNGSEYGSEDGPSYNPGYDLNADGFIDSTDRTITITNGGVYAIPEEMYDDTRKWAVPVP